MGKGTTKAIAVKAEANGVERVVTNLQTRRKVSQREGAPQIAVGYDAPYAIFVHERLDLHHKNGQAKFLEAASRRYAQEIGRIVQRALRSRRTMAQALLEGATKLLRESQKLVPVDTGRLKRSGYARVVKQR